MNIIHVRKPKNTDHTDSRVLLFGTFINRETRKLDLKPVQKRPLSPSLLKSEFCYILDTTTYARSAEKRCGVDVMAAGWRMNSLCDHRHGMWWAI